MVNEGRQTRVPNWQRQAWLTEYQVCQQAVNANASRYWTIVGIFMAINTGVIAWVVSILTSNSLSFTNVNTKWLVLVFGVGIIVILVLLWYWLGRVNYFVRIRYFRMQEIEGELGMLANLTIHWLDHPKEVPNEQSGRINKLRTSYPAPPLKETTCLRWIFCALGTIWVVFIILAFIFSVC